MICARRSLITHVAFSRAAIARLLREHIIITITRGTGTIYLQGSRDVRREAEKIRQGRLFGGKFNVLASQHIHCIAYLGTNETKYLSTRYFKHSQVKQSMEKIYDYIHR